MRQNMEDRVSVMSDPRTNAKMIDDLLQEANGKLYYVPRDHSNFTPPCREQGAKCYGRSHQTDGLWLWQFESGNLRILCPG
jgi:hypothetical protein